MTLAASLLLLLSASPADAVNILFYGNSYTNVYTANAPRSVPDLVQEIATAAGQATPNTVNAAVNAQDFAWHLANNTAVISNTLGAGEQWDVVVMQNYSTRPTVSVPNGNLAQHRANAVGLYQQVAAHSPGVKPVMYETWARGLGSSVLNYFAGGQAQMQQELRDGYNLAAADINTAAGSAIAEVAAVGDAWENANYNNLHSSDLSHPNQRGRMLTALVIYSTIYDDDTSDLFLSGGLDATLSSMGLAAVDGDFLTQVSDATVIPEPAMFILLTLGGTLLINRRP
jgi:hypothetical protein